MATLEVQDNTPRVQYTATAGQTIFPYPFIIFDTGDLKVYQNDTLLTEITHYSNDTINDNNGGNTTLVSGATLGDIITIERDIPIERLTDYQQGGDFDPNDWNVELRKLVATMQQLERDIARKFGFSVTSVFANATFPDGEASRVIQWDAAGTDLENGPTSTEITNAEANAVSAASDATAAAASAAAAASSASSINLPALVATDTGRLLVVDAAGTGHELFSAGTALQKLVSGGVDALPSWVADGIFSDSIFRIQDNADATKQLDFEVSAITTGTKRTVTMPDANVDLTSVRQATALLTGYVELLTDAEFETGTDTTRAATAAAIKNGLGFTKRFESSGNTITTVSSVVLAHGLGVEPIFHQVYLECTTAEHGWSIGDKVFIGTEATQSTSAGSEGVLVSFDATNLVLRYGGISGSVFYIQNKTTFARVALTNGNWRVGVVAWA